MNENICNALLPNGLNGNCLVPVSEVEVPIITKANVVFDSLTDVLNAIKWKNLVQVDLSAFSPAAITSYEPTTDDPNIATAESTGKKIVTSTPIPSGMVYLDTNSCDYAGLLKNLKGGVYGVIYALKGKKVILEERADGKYAPLLATVNAITKGIPLKDTFNNYPMYINHLDYESWENAKVISLPFNPVSTLKKAMPAGANMSIVTAYNTTTGVVRVMLNDRCSIDGLENAALEDFVITSSNALDTPAVTAVAAVAGSAGQYDVTVNKEAIPVELAAGDYVYLQYKKLAGSVVTKISNNLQVLAE